MAFQKMKEAKLVDSAKKGYSFVIDELNSTSSRKKQSQYASVPKEELSTKTDIVIVPSKQSRFSKKWDSFKEKVLFLVTQMGKLYFFIITFFV